MKFLPERPPVVDRLRWLFARPIAHRGLHSLSPGHVENTVSAFKAACDRGFSLEFDVQLTGDGHVVVFHDFTLERLTEGRGDIRDHSLAALQKYSLKGTSDRIETLDGVLEVVDGQVPAVIEVKSRFDGNLALCERVLAIVNARPANIAIKSFDPDVIAFARGRTDLPRGIIGMNAYEFPAFDRLTPLAKKGLARLDHIGESQPDFLSWNVFGLQDARETFAANASRLPMMTWTVRTPQDWEQSKLFADQMVFEGFLPQHP